MEILIIFLITIVLFGIVYLIYRPKSNNKRSNQLSSKVNENIKNNSEETIVENKTISFVNGDGIEKEISLNVVANDGGILKISKEDGSLTDVYHASGLGHAPNAIVLGTAGSTIGKYDSCINKNHLCVLGREGMYSDYYIDINDISKIEVNVQVGSCNDYDEDDDFEKYSMTIHTKNASILDDLEYDFYYRDKINTFLDLIKEINNSIIIVFTYKIYMNSSKFGVIKYDFGEKLNIREYELLSNGSENYLSESVSYEINISYKDIKDSDVVDFENDSFCVNVKTNSGKYLFVFSTSEESTKFYNELNNH